MHEMTPGPLLSAAVVGAALALCAVAVALFTVTLGLVPSVGRKARWLPRG